MTVSLILHNGVVLIPTSYTIQKGFYFEHSPIEAVPVEKTQELREVLLAAVERGNPPVSRAEAKALSGSKSTPMLKATGARSWNALDLQIKGSWSLKDRNGVYKIQVDRPAQPRGWQEDSDKSVEFPPGTSLDDVISRLIAMIQERAQQ